MLEFRNPGKSLHTPAHLDRCRSLDVIPRIAVTCPSAHHPAVRRVLTQGPHSYQASLCLARHGRREGELPREVNKRK